MVFVSLIGIVSVFGNLILVFVVIKSKELRHSQYVYKCSIAVSDAIWGVIITWYYFYTFLAKFSLAYIQQSLNSVIPTKIVDRNNITTYKYEIDLVSSFRKQLFLSQPALYYMLIFSPITLFVSFISLVFAAGDRYLAIAFPLKYKQINTIRWAKVFSVVIWLTSIVVYFFSVALSVHNNFLLQPKSYSYLGFS